MITTKITIRAVSSLFEGSKELARISVKDTRRVSTLSTFHFMIFRPGPISSSLPRGDEYKCTNVEIF